MSKTQKKTRKEKDSLGEIEISENAYYGSFTKRALKNFKISGINAPQVFQQALGIVKLASLEANSNLNLIEKKKALAIKKACHEFIEGKYSDQFVLDIFQAGAGTSYNMNANEIIANRANELLGGKKGKYDLVHPNNHINMAQSTNDVIPTAIKLAILLLLPNLLNEIQLLKKSINRKAQQYKNVVKVGRTHLQDAVPISFEQAFNSYKIALEKSRNFIQNLSEELKEISLGGTAVGTGITADPDFRPQVVKELKKLTKINFKSGKNLTELANNFAVFSNFSASLRSLATNLLNFSTDLCLMNSGPKAGLSEIDLPAVQPGSSIMPGKVNPSIPEAIKMICFQVLGNDKTVELASQRSNFELNVMGPIIMYNLLQSVEILSNGLKTLRTLAIDGLTLNTEQLKKTFENSLCEATALSPHLGYNKTAEVVKSALKKRKTIREEILDQKIMKKEELEEILALKNLTKPFKKKA